MYGPIATPVLFSDRLQLSLFMIAVPTQPPSALHWAHRSAKPEKIHRHGLPSKLKSLTFLLVILNFSALKIRLWWKWWIKKKVFCVFTIPPTTFWLVSLRVKRPVHVKKARVLFFRIEEQKAKTSPKVCSEDGILLPKMETVLYISIFWKDFRNKKDFGFFKRSFKLKNRYRKQTIIIH